MCGIFGLYRRKTVEPLYKYVRHGIGRMEHRGQQSAGVVLANGKQMKDYRGLGRVKEALSNCPLTDWPSHLGIAHNRYATTGDGDRLDNAQPFLRDTFWGPVALVHNGNLTNLKDLERRLDPGNRPVGQTDSELILALISQQKTLSLDQAIADVIPLLKGSFSLLIMSADALYAVRDANGIRPLAFGQNGQSFVFASEGHETNLAEPLSWREVRAGELIKVDRRGLHSRQLLAKTTLKHCAFEYFYLANPSSDGYVFDRKTMEIRLRLGRRLAREAPAKAGSLVIAVPTSGLLPAFGYAEALGMELLPALSKNPDRDVRTFIQSAETRNQSAWDKLILDPRGIDGRDIVVIDDSLVRGNVAPKIISMLRQAGAKTVTLLLASPPIINSCELGIAIPNREQLIAHRLGSIDAIMAEIGADELAYLSREGMAWAINIDPDELCLRCFTGNDPTPSSKSSYNNSDLLPLVPA